MQIKSLPPKGISVVSQPSPYLEYQGAVEFGTPQNLFSATSRTPALWRHNPVVRLSQFALAGLTAACGAFLSDPSTILAGIALGMMHIDPGDEEISIAFPRRKNTNVPMKLYKLATKGKASARAALEGRLATEPQTVGMVYDIWKNDGETAARDILQGIDVAHHTSNAIVDPQAVFALSLLRTAGNAAAREAMLKLDIMEIAAIARNNPHGVYALTHLKKANHETAGVMMARMDVTGHAQKAERNPFAVYALFHLSRAGNASALNAMENLDIENLVAMMESDEHALRAINMLVEAGSESALVAMISRIPGANEDVIHAQVDAAQRDASALVDFFSMMQDLGPEAKNLVRMLNISNLSVNTSTMPEEDRWALVDIIEELTVAGNESAFTLLCRAARNNAWATWLLDKLKFRHRIDAAEAMTNLDVSLYAEPARTAPSVVFALQLLAYANNPGAIEIMRNLDTTELISRASSLRDPEAVKEVIIALEALARHGNVAAAEWLHTYKTSGDTIKTQGTSGKKSLTVTLADTLDADISS